MSARLLFLSFFPLFLSSCSDDGQNRTVYTGTMDAVTVRVSAQTPGLIMKLSCAEGETVKQGQVLAEIDAEKIGYQLDQNRSMLQELTHQYQTASAQLGAAKANRNNLKQRYDRFTALLSSRAVTQQSVDDLRTQLDAAEEQVRGAEATLQSIQSRKKQVEAGMQVTTRQRQDATITSPLGGTVLVRYAEEGELVTMGSPICEIASLGALWTKIYIAEKELHAIRLGQRVKVEVDGLPDKKFEGTITWISDRAEFTPKTILTEETRTTLVFPAKVTVVNPEGILKIGMPVSVIVEKGS